MKKFFGKIGKFFKDLKSELKKVIWPTPSQLVNNTIIVLIFILVIGVCVWLLDALFAWGLSLLS